MPTVATKENNARDTVCGLSSSRTAVGASSTPAAVVARFACMVKNAAAAAQP